MKNKKGSAQIIVAVIVVVIAAVAGYFLLSKKPEMSKVSNKSENNTGVVSVKCPYNDSTLCNYLNNFTQATAFKDGVTMKSVMTDKNSGQKIEGIIEVDGKNSRFTSMNNGKETASIINYQGIMYMKDMADGKWTVFENKATGGNVSKNQFDSESVKANLRQFSEEAVDKLSYKKIGKERCPPYNCFKYQLATVAVRDVTQYIYFDDKEYLLRKTRTENNKNGGIVEMTYDYKTVKIEKPSPVKKI